MSATEELLGRLHDAVAQDLLTKIQDGSASPAEISTAVKFLKDNGIEAIPAAKSLLGDLSRSLPEFGDEETLHGRH